MKTKDNLIKMKIRLTEEQYRRVILKEETQNKFTTIILVGPQGVGKSTISNELSDKLDMEVISSDAEIDQGDWKEEETWAKQWQKRKENEYPGMIQYLKNNLGKPVILDVGGSHGVWDEKHIGEINSLISQYPNRFLILPSRNMGTSKEILRDRLLNRDEKMIKKTMEDKYWDEMLKGNKDLSKDFDPGDKKFYDDMVSRIIAGDEEAIKKAESFRDDNEKRLNAIKDPNKEWKEFKGDNKGKHEYNPDSFVDYTQYFIENMKNSRIANHIIYGQDRDTIVKEIMEKIDYGQDTDEEWQKKYGKEERERIDGKEWWEESGGPGECENCYKKAFSDQWWASEQEGQHIIDIILSDDLKSFPILELYEEYNEEVGILMHLYWNLIICYLKCEKGIDPRKITFNDILEFMLEMGKSTTYWSTIGPWVAIIKHMKKWWNDGILKMGKNGKVTDQQKFKFFKESVGKRKIILTESQHRRMVKEDARHAVLADKLRQELAGADLKRTMHDLTTLYAYTEEEIIGSPVLMKLVMDKLLKEIRDNHYISRELKDTYGNYFAAVGLSAAKEILNSNISPYSKFLQLDGVVETIPYTYVASMDANREVVREMRDGLIYDTLQYLFDNFSPRDALKRASIMVNRRMVDYEEMFPLVKQFADKHGITLFNKYKGMTFAKKDGMLRSLVNYLKDAEPKTKEGFLDYIDSVGRGPGQHTVFWGAAKNAGLIVPVRNGRQITYQLGPNYKAWENDKLVAFE